jgi:hypothetical protein
MPLLFFLRIQIVGGLSSCGAETIVRFSDRGGIALRCGERPCDCPPSSVPRPAWARQRISSVRWSGRHRRCQACGHLPIGAESPSGRNAMKKALPFLLILSAILVAVIWSSDQITFEGERTLYAVTCVGGSWDGLRCTGRLVAGDRHRFRASRTRQEVVSWVAGSTEPTRIQHGCEVIDRGNWKCPVQADAAAPIIYEMVNSRPRPSAAGAAAPLHGVPKWQWWVLRLGVPGFTEAAY